MVTRSKHADLEHKYSIEGVITRYPNLKWKIETLPESRRFIPGEKPPRLARAIMGGDKATGHIHVMMVIENAVVPLHRHKGDDPEYVGEVIFTFEGCLVDRLPSGEPISHERNMPPILHPCGSTHSPRADYWFGSYIQPFGSELVSDS